MLRFAASARLGTGARILIAAAALAATAVVAPPASAGTVPANFQDSTVFTGLTEPTAVRFASDGRVFVAEKRGVIKVFDNLQDTTATVFADLNVQVYNFWDRGMLGFALAPNFPADPHVYVMYTYDGAIGAQAPRWGTPGVYVDPCPNPPGATGDGCVVSGRISRLTASGNVASGPEEVLVHDWCQQYPSHSIGSLHFGADGALYATGGDGASFNFADWGQDGNPRNPCGDPPGGVGAALSPPTAQGGALRSQDVRTTADPTSLDGTVIRIDPNTGAGLLDNPFALSPDANARRIVAHGFRNPFRFTIRPGTSDVWVGDVGWSDWEEINRLGVTNDSVADNFGWPCYEGVGPQPGYDGANLNLCENLYSAGGVTAPVYTYAHSQKVVPGESCSSGSSSISGMAFYNGGNYPANYAGALFFADYSRKCIWAMLAGTNGLPNPSNRITFDAGAAGPVDLQIGPAGDLFYVDFDAGTIRRVRYLGSTNNAPVARVTASPTTGGAPLTVQFNASTSSDPDPGDTLSYTWDLDGDGTYGDATIAQPSRTYGPGTYTVRVRVSDNHGAFDTASILISANGNPPVPTIDLPATGSTWKVGDQISFSGHANDTEDGQLGPAALTWSVTIQHCPSDCHTHPLHSFPGVAFGNFTGVDHEFPSHLELKLTATDSSGLSASTTMRLDPQTVDLTFASAPTGLQLVVGSTAGTTPFTRRVIVGSNNTIVAGSPQTANGRRYAFNSWSDGGAASHNITAGATPTTYTATFDDTGPAGAPGLVGSYSFDQGSGATATDLSGQGNNGTLANGATWATAGKYGGAISFDGVNDMVNVADAASLDLTSGMTLEAWVRPSVTGWPYRTVILKEQPGGLVYAIYLNDQTRPLGSVFSGGAERLATTTTPLAANTWTHLATTYDGANLRLYVNGTLVTTTPWSGAITTSAGVLRMGANTIWPEEAFQGLIDEVRVYNRALTGTEINSDMATPLGASDTAAPSDPTGFASTGSTATSIATSWVASTDNVGVAGYRVFVDGAQADTTQQTTYTFTGLACGSSHTLGVEAYDLAGNTSGRATLDASAGACDTTPPTVAITAPAGGATVANTVSVTANAADNDGVAGVQFRLDGANLGAEDTSSPYAVSWDTRTVANGAHTLTAVARDSSGNITTSANVAVTVTNTAQPPGLVAAYSFDQGSGTAAPDASGTGNNGTLTNGPTWATAGKYGGAINFDGVNDNVTIPDSTSLDLTTGMTLEAWVRPTTLGTTWRTAVAKQRSNGLVYGLYANRNTQRPNAQVFSANAVRQVDGTAVLALNVWTHLAATYDGSVLRLYVNGSQVGQVLHTGTIGTSNAVMRIGGNTVRSEWFQGLIDEVRIYNRALSPADIQGDMSRSIGVIDTTPPSAPANLTGTASTSSVLLNWQAATDNTGVVHYNVHRANAPGFTPSAVNRIAQPTGLSYTDSGLSSGPYYYKVTAQDAAGNIGADSNEFPVFVMGDIDAPTQPGNFATTTITRTSIATSWVASTDNVGVAGYRVFVDGAQADTTQQTTYTFTGLACGSSHTLGVEAYDLAGNTSGRATLDATAGACDTTPPTVAITAPAAGATVANTVSVTANAADNDGVAGVQFRLDGANLGAEDTSSPYSVSWDTRTVANGAHTLTAVARDSSGNITTSANVAVTVTNTAQPPGLVAAYSFDQGSGTAAPDASGTGNNGTLTNGPTWATAGKYGGAINFDGVNDNVTIPDSTSLDLTTGMTLEAWVRPAVTGWPYRTVILKEQPGGLVYALYITQQTRPLGSIFSAGAERLASGTTALVANTWTHLATTYDGANVRLYVNGTLAATTAWSGTITTSTGAIKLGANAIWPEEAFQGLIDEVRIYNRALTATEVTDDMNRPVNITP